MKKILSIIGARPQFIKHAPLQIRLQEYFTTVTVHTGQHYDTEMSDIFFNDLNIPKPNYIFDVAGGKSHGEQTGQMMVELEKVLLHEKPDMTLVYGDTNSTLAGVLTAAKLNTPIIHIEAGLRSFNRTMPEEINRIVADTLSALLFCPTKVAFDNLAQEGISHPGIYICGDVMIDCLEMIRHKISRLCDQPYIFLTIHRPYNTDDMNRMNRLIKTLGEINRKIIFPIHPRTKQRLNQFNIDIEKHKNIVCLNPVGYIESISYQAFSDCVITDSGGVQKEAYALKRKCITLRSETEWVETLHNGWNSLIFEDIEGIGREIDKPVGEHLTHLYGDGKSASFIASVINEFFSNK